MTRIWKIVFGDEDCQNLCSEDVVAATMEEAIKKAAARWPKVKSLWAVRADLLAEAE